MAHLLESGQGGEGGERLLPGGGLRSGLRQQSTAGGQDPALIDGEGDGSVEHRRTVPKADGRRDATA